MRFTLVPCLALFMSGCSDLPRLTGPGPVNLSNPAGGGGSGVDLANWSPYAVVHMPGGALEAYKKTMPALISRGNLRGIRFDVWSKDSGSDSKGILNMGLDGLAIISDLDLLEPNIEPIIDIIVSRFPEIRVFQVGNEISTLPEPGLRMGMEQYMKVFDRVYRHVEKKYPYLRLVSQSTFGSGNYGSIELEKMAELGLNNYPREKVIIGVNCYGIASASAYAGVLGRYFGGYEVWVTETGINGANEQIDFVKNVYPVLQTYLRPARIYWYAYYDGGEGPSDSDFGSGLIKNVNHPSGLSGSPLYKALAGE